VSTDDLVSWLRQQLDDEERVARATDVADFPWVAETTGPYGPQVRTVEDGDDAQWSRAVNVQMWTCDDEQDGCPDVARQWIAEATHIALHDPAAVLRKVEAHRRILDLHVTRDGTGGTWDTDPAALCNEDSDVQPCSTLRLLASVYSDRPGYRQEWAP
jgi:hypothetical protein